MHPMGGGTGSDDVTATAANVLSGKTAVTSDSDDEAIEGTMPNNGAMNVTLTPGGNGTTSKNVEAGYYSGGTITADGQAAYSAGHSQGVTDADNRVNTASASYSSGYTNGNAHVTYKDFHVTAQAPNQNSGSATTFNAHLNGYTMIGYGFISTGGVGWNYWRPYSFYISNSGENITAGVIGSGDNNSEHYDDVSNIPSRWLNLDCTVRVFYK